MSEEFLKEKAKILLQKEVDQVHLDFLETIARNQGNYKLLKLIEKKRAGEEIKEADIEDIENYNHKFYFKEEYEKIIEILKKYMDLRPEYYPVIACWIIGTYFHRYFPTYPFLFFNAVKGSGKTRLLKLISNLAYNGKLVLNISESVLFRTAHNRTLCIDEIEHIGGKEKTILRELLNAAYKRGGVVERAVKVKDKDRERFIVESFNVYGSIAMANIWGLDDVLADRCIILLLERSSNKKITRLIEDFEINEEIQKIRESLQNTLNSDTCAVTLHRLEHIYNLWNNYIYNNMCHLWEEYKESQEVYINLFKKIETSDLEGRHLELFFPIFLVADWCDNLNELLEIAKKIVTEKKEEELIESREANLVKYIATEFAEETQETTDFVAVSDIAKGFREYMEGAEWVTSDWVGRYLNKLGLVIFKRRTSRKREVVINFKKAKEKLKMYLTKEALEMSEDRVKCQACGLLVYADDFDFNKNLCKFCASTPQACEVYA